MAMRDDALARTEVGTTFWRLYREHYGRPLGPPYTTAECLDVLRWLASPEGRSAAKVALAEIDART